MQEGEEEYEFEEINDEVYLKFHNFFEKKEKEYQKKSLKVSKKNQIKKIQKSKMKIKMEIMSKIG